MKTYVLILSKTFPKYHPRAGQATNYYKKALDQKKLHTIRGNYPLWKKRIEKVNAGEACISVREWTGKPYNSKQKELFELQKNEVGIQKIEDSGFSYLIDDKLTEITEKHLSKNDGLRLVDFLCWFPEPFSKPMAIIHFTGFRY